MRRLGALVGYVVAPAALLGAVAALDLPRWLPPEAYRDGVTPLYLDRPYVNEAENPALAGYRVVRVPRHLRFEIELTLSRPARVVRLIADENDNRVFAAWEPAEELRVSVPGRSCVLTRAVAKRFAPGVSRLPPGGPLASAPLLVETDGEIAARTTLAWNKLTPFSAGDWAGFLRSNARKLGASLLAWAAWCWSYRRVAARLWRGGRDSNPQLPT